MKKYRFIQVDVFTDRPLEGNPLAVFPDAKGLSSGDMLAIARETNLSETTFILPRKGKDAPFPVRIFTPAKELPFAGHPVLGTSFVIADLDMSELTEPKTSIALELGVGVIPVELLVQRGKLEKVIMTQKKPSFIKAYENLPLLAEALSLKKEELEAANISPELVSTGLPQLMVPVATLTALKRIRVNFSAMDKACAEAGTDIFYPFTLDTGKEDVTVRSRGLALFGNMFIEDPATGSASGCLGAYLVKNELVPSGSPVTRIINEQGEEISRPSRIEIEVEGSPDNIERVRVGGGVVKVMEGELLL
jgi:trans-2,3-dihydro-3-hydroxyanthranilate isomerase